MKLVSDSVHRALNDDPNLLERDLQTIRNPIRDKIETVTGLQFGGVLTGSPKNHNVLLPGTGIATFHYESGKIAYDPELSDIKLNAAARVP